ncbi:hypothetical protein [Blastococcus mobilis]|uniref:Uncharacterized protein n=1 Tax=Blastococcus mobilis TaxID=1938746 RepID=A0A238VY39_9ACTN|nr:hypothetical protein [Blastococcus mobilis]SNR39222.1 hypothetical protein SAMN06272737_105163 [Blastococcus mobilis]
MTTTPDSPVPDDENDQPDDGSPELDGAPGAEIGLSGDGGSTFEPEEDAPTEG